MPSEAESAVMAFFFASRAAAKQARRPDARQEGLNRVWRERCLREQAEREHFAMKVAIADYERSIES